MNQRLIVRQFSDQIPYHISWQAMRQFTHQRNAETNDELWLLQHPPVFTQGLAGKPEHVLDAKNIPIVKTDRGGQVTYHGPGQLMVYSLFNLKRLTIGIRDFVIKLEQIVISMLASQGIKAEGKRDAPGVYIHHKKICSIGLRVRQGYSYHGMAFNVDMDLTPFNYINPCGFRDLKMTTLTNHLPRSATLLNQIQTQIVANFIQNFGYTHHIIEKNTFPLELKI